MAAEKLDFKRLAPVMAGQRQERGVERGVRLRTDGRVIDRRALELLEPVVGARVELDDVEPLLDQRDEGQEQRAIEPVPIEIVRRDIRRRHHHHPGGEQRREQSAQDHRVGDVAHRKLVEAQERGLARQLRRDRRDRVLAHDLAALQRLAPLMQPCVHVGHEGVKMRPALARPRRPHRRTCPSASSCRRRPDRGCRGRAAAQRPCARSANRRRRASARGDSPQARAQRIELPRQLRLRRVKFEPAVGNERTVALGDTAHGRVLAGEREGRNWFRSY